MKTAIPILRCLLILWSLLLVPDTLTAQAIADNQRPDPSAQRRAGALNLAERIRRDDANGDGRVTRQEFAGPPAIFRQTDRNSDGTLSAEEIAAAGPRGRRRAQIPIRRRPTAEDVEVLRDVVFGSGGERDLTMHLVLPKKRPSDPMPVYVWIHGGGWKGGTKEGGVGKLVHLARLGIAGATIEYRLSGEATFPAQIEDCKCAIRFLRAHAGTYGLDPARIAVGGSSAGGHLAALVGTSGGVTDLEGSGGWTEYSSQVQAVVDLYGPTDFVQFVKTPGYESHARANSPESLLLGGEVLKLDSQVKRVNPITYVDSEDPPFLIIHGSADGTVPPNQSESMHRALRQAGVESSLHVIEGAGHGGPKFATPEIRKMQTEFLLRWLSRPEIRSVQSQTNRNVPSLIDENGQNE